MSVLLKAAMTKVDDLSFTKAAVAMVDDSFVPMAKLDDSLVPVAKIDDLSA
jgi:hypothetical protein